MDSEHISYFSYLSGGLLFAALTIVLLQLWRKKSAHISLVIAVAVSTAWELLIAANYRHITLEPPELLILETIRYGAWIVALLEALKFTTGQPLPQRFHRGLNGCWMLSLVAAIILKYTAPSLANNSNLLIWNNLLLAIVGLISVEQLFKNTGHFRLIKLYSLVIGGLFVYDIYVFSYSLIFNQIDLQLWQARGIINGIAALLMALGALTIAAPNITASRFAISRPVAFYTTSMTASGSFLALMAIGGYYVQLYGGSWGELIHILLLFLALLLISVLFVSNTVRSQLNVWINKHFFRHKYDYRVEWLKLINSLSHQSETEDFHQRTLDTLASIFKSPCGGLWIKHEQHFKLAANSGLTLDSNNNQEPINSTFCQALQDNEWVFSPKTPDSKNLELNNLLPQWINDIPSLWLVSPLLTENELLGFVIMAKPQLDDTLTWEDLDLLKTIGRQVASYLDRHQAAEQLAESRQFDAFNKLTAFIMHDLKNLIAQQALVVENAAKHKDNPAFIEDAINTIDNSVGRMNTLLKKLQQDEPSELRSFELDHTLIEAIKKCQELKPLPSLQLETKGIYVNADPDRLLMTFVHIIKNAQEATDNTGFIDVTLRTEDNNAIIVIEDNGAGMSEEFIKNQLFKPFNTTKSGKGMGIGVYQAKEYIESIGGTVVAESSLDSGTTFTISIPSIKE